jgi:hypothetical protein
MSLPRVGLRRAGSQTGRQERQLHRTPSRGGRPSRWAASPSCRGRPATCCSGGTRWRPPLSAKWGAGSVERDWGVLRLRSSRVGRGRQSGRPTRLGRAADPTITTKTPFGPRSHSGRGGVREYGCRTPLDPEHRFELVAWILPLRHDVQRVAEHAPARSPDGGRTSRRTRRPWPLKLAEQDVDEEEEEEVVISMMPRGREPCFQTPR